MSNFRATQPKLVSRKAGTEMVRSNPLTGREKRRGVRVNSRVPVSVEWNSQGESLRGEAKTRVVGPYGCLIVLPQGLAIDQRIRVTNLVSSQTNPGVVVWCGNEGAEGWELGVELINPEMNFWGLDL